MAECKHPEAFVSIKNGHRVCGLCGAVVPEPAAEVKPEKKEGKKNARK